MMIYLKKHRVKKFIYAIRKNIELLSVEAVRTFEEWKKILRTSDEIRRLLN